MALQETPYPLQAGTCPLPYFLEDQRSSLNLRRGVASHASPKAQLRKAAFDLGFVRAEGLDGAEGLDRYTPS